LVAILAESATFFKSAGSKEIMNRQDRFHPFTGYEGPSGE